MLDRHHLRVLHKLGDALYGAVLLCEDAKSERVAVKQISLRKARHALERNCNLDNPWDERRTATALTRLGGHENILQFRHEFIDGDSWFVVMEYCDGGDLLDLLHRETPMMRLPESLAIECLSQITRGVHFLHTNSIAHRDLSLENVLIQDGVCKISDFGLSTDARRVCDEKVGKAYYMAPEVVAEQSYDPAATDMWSLGVMLFILLTGSPLVPSASIHDKSFQALEAFGVAKILDAWGMAADVSAATTDLLAGLLEVNPLKRLTIGDVVRHPCLQPLHEVQFQQS
jgi:serine/threonine protein kinase